MKPIYKWSGGKRDEIKLFKKHYPDNFNLYIEPFFGGGAVFFDLNFNSNVINDKHTESIIFLNEIKKGNSKKIYDLMASFDNNEKVYYYIRDEYKPSSSLEEAFRFFYLRKTCFRGMLRYNSSGKFNIPFGRYKNYSFEELLDDSYESLLKNTFIFNDDFDFIFNNFNDKNNFVFLDPPYDSEFTNYGYCTFGKEDHFRLSELFKETNNKCLLIIGKTDFITSLYKEYIVEEYNKEYKFKIYGGRIGQEINNKHLVIKNYWQKILEIV